MDPATILADVQIVVGIARIAIQVGEDVAPFIETIYQLTVEKRALTDLERADMLARESALRAVLQAPFPPIDDSMG